MSATEGAIYVVRHGETVWNAEGRRQGRMDSPLTARGVEQARAVGRALRKALRDARGVVLESSPLGRARATAEIVCRELGLAQSAIVPQPLLAELHNGDWQGLTAAEIDARFPGARDARDREKWSYTFPGGESYADAYRRATAWLSARKHASDTIAVTHEMLSRTLLGAYAGCTSDEMLALSHPHDRIYCLWGGRITEAAA